MSRHRDRRRTEKQRRQTQLPTVRQATRVERLAYTRTQAAEALGVSRSTFDRRVLPYVETVDLPWGARLIPVDELERFVAARRRAAQARPRAPVRPGRKAGLAVEIVARIRKEHAGGKSLGAIARALDADGVKTAQGGRRWWPSTVRAVVRRSRSPEPG